MIDDADMDPEVQRLRSAIATIHDHLHADRLNEAHDACECAMGGASVTQPNLSETDGARAMEFAAAFNELAARHRVIACCVMVLPSTAAPNAVSLQLCGAVSACKLVEAQIRGGPSTYMGDHQRTRASRRRV